MTQTLVLGIDPGLSGALALYDNKSKEVVGIHDMPLRKDIRGKKHLDLYALSAIFDAYAPKIAFAVIEDVGARPGQGVTSMFRFGYVSGAAAGIVASYNIPAHFVKPAVWKMLCGLSHDKNLSRETASRYFPHKAEFFKRKKNDGRAEALMLAVFGAERLSKGITR